MKVVLLVAVLFCVIAVSRGITIKVNLANSLAEALILKESNLSDSAKWVQEPLKELQLQHTADVAITSSNGEDSGFVSYGIPEFDRLRIKFAWYYPVSGEPQYNVTVSPAPWLGGIDGVSDKDGVVTVRGYVGKMCESVNEKYCLQVVN